MPDKETATRVSRQLEDYFGAFRRKRENYNDLVHRLLTPVMDAHVTESPDADWRDPALEQAEHDVADVLTENPTKFDGVAAGEQKAQRDAADAIRLYAAAVWNQVDIGRWWDRASGMGQARHGVKVSRRMARDHGSPPKGKKIEDIEEWYRSHSDTFYIDDVETLAVRWYPLRKPKQFIWEYEVPCIDAFDDYEVDGEHLGAGYESGKKYRPVPDGTNSRPSGVAWTDGDDYVQGQSGATSSVFEVVVYEYETKDTCPVCADEHPLWKGIEIVKGKGKKTEEGDIVYEYDLPWRGASFMVTGGRESNDRDPDLHYRPFLHTAYVHAANVNWATSRIMQLANEHSSTSSKYGHIEKDSPTEFLQEVQSRDWNFGLENAPKGFLKLLPPGVTIEEIPNSLAETLLIFSQDSYGKMQQALPNPYVLGTALEQGGASQPATNFERGYQQARVPYQYLLTQSDKTILEDFFNDGVFHAIKLWNYQDKQTFGENHPERKFYVRLDSTMEDNLKRGGAEDGKEICMSASILEQGPKLVLNTSNLSLQDQAENRRQAIEAKQQRAITSRQLIEAFGYADTEKQMALLDEEDLRAMARQMGAQAQQAAIAAIMAAVSEIDPAWLFGILGLQGGGGGAAAMPGVGGGPQVQTSNTPSVRLNPSQQLSPGPMPAGTVV
jgi:hypothetical protein